MRGVLSVAALVVGVGVVQSHLFATQTLVSLDSASQFFPWYAYLGQHLRAGHIPGWNPYVFSGTPFIANPLTGWTYLPAMVLFAALPLPDAAHVYLVAHPMLAGGATFALARVVGLNRTGALIAGLAYANSGFFQVQNLCCFAFASVYAWLPLTVLGAELAIRARSWPVRRAWYGLAAVGVSQILAGWLGQGAYYALMLLAGYVVYRTVTALVPALRELVHRPTAFTILRELLAHGLGIFAFGAALAAAGLLPRLEFNTLSNLAGGYSGAEASVGGLAPRDWLLLGTPGFWYAGLTVLALACAAPLLARRACPAAVAYLGGFSVLALLISGRVETPLHWLLYHLLPGFARLHPHAPERILTVAYLGPALLAGVSVTALTTTSHRHLRGVVLVLLVAVDLTVGGAHARADFSLTDPLNGADKLTPVDLSTYYRPDLAAQFLQSRQANGQEPFRYLGYAPFVEGEIQYWPYSTRFSDPATAALDVDNRGLLLGLQDVQGYDASHLGAYDAYLLALNGHDQNYHDAEIFSSGLSSPLLDLLGARYVIVPMHGFLRPDDQAALARFSAAVFEDAQVRILENPHAFPRAWIVHAAQQAPPPEALAMLAAGQVDAHQVALVEEPPPPVVAPTDAALDRAVVATDAPDSVSVNTTTGSPGLLVLSEMAYPAWRATVDNVSVPLLVADGGLSAVLVPAGSHTVTLRFESSTLWLGSLISLAAVTALLAAVATALVFRSGRRPLNSPARGQRRSAASPTGR